MYTSERASKEHVGSGFGHHSFPAFFPSSACIAPLSLPALTSRAHNPSEWHMMNVEGGALTITTWEKYLDLHVGICTFD